MKKINKTVFIHPSTLIIGDVEINEHSSTWPYTVLRGDVAPIRIGIKSNVQDMVVIHTNFNQPTVIGDNVTIGHSAVLHGCTVGNNCMIGMGAIVLDGAIIEPDCIIGAGAVVTENKRIPRGSLVLGVPGKPVRQLTEQEIKSITSRAEEYVQLATVYRTKKIR